MTSAFLTFIQLILGKGLFFVFPCIELLWLTVSIIRYVKRNKENEQDCHSRKNQVIISGSVLALNIAYILFSLIAGKLF
jgi:hypothetical protein